MSVENFDQLDGAIAFLDDQTPEDCFYCRKPLSGIGVLWYGGSDKAIGLHPDCAMRFGAHVVKDAIHAARIIAGKPVIVGIGVGLVESRQ